MTDQYPALQKALEYHRQQVRLCSKRVSKFTDEPEKRQRLIRLINRHESIVTMLEVMCDADAEIKTASEQFSKHQAEWWDKQEKLEAAIARLKKLMLTHTELALHEENKRLREALMKAARAALEKGQ